MEKYLKIIAIINIVGSILGSMYLCSTTYLPGIFVLALILNSVVIGIFIWAFAELLECVKQIKKNTSGKTGSTTYYAGELPTL